MLVMEAYSCGETLIKQGMVGTKLFIIVKGSVECRIEDKAHDKPIVVNTHMAGGYFGEGALVNDAECSATVVVRAHLFPKGCSQRHVRIATYCFPFSGLDAYRVLYTLKKGLPQAHGTAKRLHPDRGNCPHSQKCGLPLPHAHRRLEKSRQVCQ